MRMHKDGLGLTLLLGALAGLPALSVDMSLPGMPGMAAEFGIDAGQVTATLSDFMIGFGLSQLVIGALSDRVGRWPVLTAALTLYALGSVAAWLVPSFNGLLAARFLQGAGAAGGTVLAFAIVRDLFEGEAARARLATISLVFSLAPVIGPSVGGLILHFADWRMVFAVQALTGAGLLVAAALGLGETRRPSPPGARGSILTESRTVAFGVVGALNLATVFCFVAGAPLVLLGQLGLSTMQFGWVFAVVTSGVLAGAWLNRLMVERGWAAAWPLGIGLGGAMLAAIVGLAVDTVPSLLLLIPVFLLITLSRGLVSPNVTHAALERIPHMAGAGSALIGAMQMLTGALAGFIVGPMFGRFGPVGVMLTMAGFATPAVLAWIHVERKYR